MSSEQQLSVLILTDNVDEHIRTCSEVLNELGHSVTTFADINEWSGDFYGPVDLLLADADWIAPESLADIRKQLPEEASVLALMGKCSDEHIDAYMSSGADDFIAKPVSIAWLKKKAALLMQSRRLFQVHQEKCQLISEYQQQQHQDQTVVISLYDNILRVNNLDTPVVKSQLSAKSIINGDMLLVGRTPDNHLHIIFSHFLGSSISSAVAASPAAEIFFGMSAKGFEITHIAEEINHKLHKLLPEDMFMAAVIVSLRPDTKTLHVLNCGFPDQILLKPQSDKPYRLFSSENPPLGSQAKIELQTSSCDIGSQNKLYLFSDDVLQIKNFIGDSFGRKALIDAILDNGYEELMDRLTRHCSCRGEGREMPLLELTCDVENAPWKSDSSDQHYKKLEALTWKAMMEFDVVSLRSLNPVPIVVNALMEIQGLQEHRQTIFMIVTELFANALDHGVLRLDSGIKSSPEGFMRFYELREERLQSAQQGSIRMLFEHKPTDAGGRLTIKFRDTGEGFDRRALTTKMENNTGFSGRGITLLESLCSSVVYQGKGNRVTVAFDWEL